MVKFETSDDDEAMTLNEIGEIVNVRELAEGMEYQIHYHVDGRISNEWMRERRIIEPMPFIIHKYRSGRRRRNFFRIGEHLHSLCNLNFQTIAVIIVLISDFFFRRR